MIICDICTGRHHTSACVIARDRVDQCFLGTPDDYTPPLDNVVQLITDHTHRRGDATRRAMPHYGRQPKGVHAPAVARTRREVDGVAAIRLA